MKKILILSITIGILMQIIPLSPVPTSRFMNSLSNAYAGEDLENLKLMIDITQKAIGAKFFSRIIQSNKKGSTGSLKITVTSKFLKESQSSKQDLMKSVYDSWKQQYKGSDENLIAFVDSKNRMVGMATKSGCIASP